MARGATGQEGQDTHSPELGTGVQFVRPQLSTSPIQGELTQSSVFSSPQTCLLTQSSVPVSPDLWPGTQCPVLPFPAQNPLESGENGKNKVETQGLDLTRALSFHTLSIMVNWQASVSSFEPILSDTSASRWLSRPDSAPEESPCGSRKWHSVSTQSCPLAQGSVSVPVQSPDQSRGLSPQSQPKWAWDWGLSVERGIE